MIRKIRRNISEAATGHRLNRYGTDRVPSFKTHRAAVASFVAALFKLDEYMKHKPHQKALQRAINEEIAMREWQKEIRETGGM